MSDEKDGGARSAPVRERVLRHLRSATLAGASIGLGCALGDEGPPVVCDPLPPPMTCDRVQTPSDLVRDVWAQASVVQTAQGLGVAIQVQPSGVPGFTVQGSAYRLEQAKVVTAGQPDGGVRVECLPDAGATQITLHVPVACAAFPAELHVAVTLPEKRAVGDGLAVWVTATAPAGAKQGGGAPKR